MYPISGMRRIVLRVGDSIDELISFRVRPLSETAMGSTINRHLPRGRLIVYTLRDTIVPPVGSE